MAEMQIVPVVFRQAQALRKPYMQALGEHLLDSIPLRVD